MSSPIPRRWLALLPPSLGSRFTGLPLDILTKPELSRSRGKLLSRSIRGTPVHAAAFIRERRLVLDSELRRDPAELRRILIHEVFHFVWVRLGNGERRGYEALVEAEWRQGARGELGWSAESEKSGLTEVDVERRTRRWRNYLSESFCDTAAWRHAGIPAHEEFTLGKRWRSRREKWFAAHFDSAEIPI